MATNKVLQTFGIGATPSQTTTTWNVPVQQITILDTTNPRFLRNLIISNQGVRGVRGTVAAGMLTADIFSALVTLEPSLAYPPFFTTQPVAATVSYSDATSFTVVVSSELSVTYQWQVSTDSGSTWSNLSNAGVYTNTTTATLNISSVSGLHNNQYRCVATQATTSAVTNSASALLTVVPKITVQPSSSSVTHPAAASFSVTASGTATVTYQWQLSTDGGTTYTNLGNTGVYTNVTTATMNISDSTGLNGNKYRVIVTDGNSQSTTSTAATLTVA